MCGIRNKKRNFAKPWLSHLFQWPLNRLFRSLCDEFAQIIVSNFSFSSVSFCTISVINLRLYSQYTRERENKFLSPQYLAIECTPMQTPCHHIFNQFSRNKAHRVNGICKQISTIGDLKLLKSHKNMHTHT